MNEAKDYIKSSYFRHVQFFYNINKYNNKKCTA